MKTRTRTLLLIMLARTGAMAQCTAGFNHIADDETLTFTNISSVPNAHFYWSFGDGSGSNDSAPVHEFPATGHYLVTLYALDTISGCNTYDEEWIDVVKPSADPCDPHITDSIFVNAGVNYVMLTESSTGCEDYNAFWSDGASGGGGSFGFWSELAAEWLPALNVGRVRYFTSDTINGYVVRQQYWLTSPVGYDRAVNYGGCSANFEVHAQDQGDSALYTFTAMNPNGVDTFFVNNGSGWFPLVGHTVSISYRYVSYAQEISQLVQHKNTDDECTTICTQEIVVRDPNYVPPPSCVIAQQPQNVMVNIGAVAQFIIETQAGTIKQWQQDAGLGWQNLTDAGPFSGVHTDTLTVANVQGWWNNYQYRCVVSQLDAGCQNTSSVAVLGIGVGINEQDDRLFRVYPMPASDRLYVQLEQEMIGATAIMRDAHGRSIGSVRVDRTLMELDLTALAPGMYLLEVGNEQGVWRTRFVKQ